MREIAKASLARYRASRRAKLILVLAAVAVAENVRDGLAQVRPSGLPISARDQTPVLVFPQPMHASRRRLFIDCPNYGQSEMRVIVFSG
jgi:hypothetical protein